MSNFGVGNTLTELILGRLPSDHPPQTRGSLKSATVLLRRAKYFENLLQVAVIQAITILVPW